MEDFIVIAVLLVIAVGIVWYLIRAKRRGQTCIGCPHSKQCGGKCNCGSKKDKTENS